jgi:hypothetical protein
LRFLFFFFFLLISAPPSGAGALYGEEVDGDGAAAEGRAEEAQLMQVVRRGRVEGNGGLGDRAGCRKSSAIGGEERSLGRMWEVRGR